MNALNKNKPQKLTSTRTKMETTNQNNRIVHASQAINEQGNLTFDVLPVDLGMSQAFNVGEDAIVLADGRIVELTGTDEDIDIVVADCIFRLKQTLVHSYWIGKNLLSAKEFFQKSYGSTKEFWKKVTQATGLSRATLENRIRIYQNFTAQEVQALAEAGTTQSIANRLLKASPAKKEEVIAQAEQGRLITSAVAGEILEMNDEEEIDSNSQVETTLLQSIQNESIKDKENDSESISQNITQNCVDVPATVSYEEVISEENYASAIKLLEQRLQSLLKAIEAGRNKSFTVRGQSIREEQAVVLAEFYNIKLPSLKLEEGEPKWVTEARQLLPKSIAQKFTPLYVMALVDGYLGYIRNQPNKPQIYEVFPKYLSKDAEKACHNIFDVGFAQAKLEAESNK